MSTQLTERTPQNPIAICRERLIQRRSELEDALEGSGIPVAKMIRAAVTAVTRMPELVTDVPFPSLWMALMQSCHDQCLPDGRQGVIIPYGRTAQWQIMYRGMIDRFQASGQFRWIGGDFHREDDRDFDEWKDEHGQHFLHRPGQRAGKIIETYAAATLTSGAFFVTIMTEADIARVRAMSRAQRADSPWQQWPEQMRLKSALKRLCKLLPMPQPLDEIVSRDDGFDPDKVPPVRAAPARPRGATRSLEAFANETPAPEPDQPEQRQPMDDGALAQEQETSSEPQGQEQQQQEHEQPPQATSVKVTQVMIETAYERGKGARAEGLQRRSIPGEYREPARAQEAIAWRKGWDGDPLEGSTP